MNYEVYYSEITEFVERKYNKKIVITKAEEGGIKLETKLLEFLPSLSLVLKKIVFNYLMTVALVCRMSLRVWLRFLKKSFLPAWRLIPTTVL